MAMVTRFETDEGAGGERRPLRVGPKQHVQQRTFTNSGQVFDNGLRHRLPAARRRTHAIRRDVTAPPPGWRDATSCAWHRSDFGSVCEVLQKPLRRRSWYAGDAQSPDPLAR